MNKFNQLCVWPGTIVGEDKVNEFVDFMKKTFGVSVEYVTEIKTNPDLDESGKPVSDTGGRNDLFFYISDDDVTKFALPRFSYGIRWWEDVIKYNDNSYLYPAEFIEKYPATW